ncbi:zinc ABC transporter substrate-binding protein [Roseibium aestuarii]|uniref:High-affinity zinc uptake system protein ZnuA n=1 Tax=Roseibium aestuarii TaxID=2600299 RepID=A0ABW4JS98_9HYPH|nr:zinc ABC transporter substrate-binding protein [Roseibium aestuarii]
MSRLRVSPLAGLALLAASTALFSAPALATPKVVATLKPIHSLTAAVMEGVGSPDLLIQGAASPHDFALKPSQAGLLQDADLVIWVGEALETSLAKPIEALTGEARVLELMEAPGLTLLEFRESDDWGHDDHAHGDEAHEHEHEDHGKDAHADGAHEDEAASEGAHEHHHEGLDPHVWLSPDNARAMTAAIAARLAELDPENAATYQANASALETQLAALKDEIAAQVAPARETGMIAFHDAYHYFEESFDLHFQAAVAPRPEVQSGAESLSHLKDLIASEGTRCLFTEPQFTPKRVQLLQDGTGLKVGTLDPLGADLADGPGLYPQLLRNMASAIADCAAN